MSRKNNVNPDHYKTAGRERQGEDIIHDFYKRWYAQSRLAAGPRDGRSLRAPETKWTLTNYGSRRIERRIDEAQRQGGAE